MKIAGSERSRNSSRVMVKRRKVEGKKEGKKEGVWTCNNTTFIVKNNLFLIHTTRSYAISLSAIHDYVILLYVTYIVTSIVTFALFEHAHILACEMGKSSM